MSPSKDEPVEGRLLAFPGRAAISIPTEAAMLHTPVDTSLFHEIPGNPTPDRATAGFMTARDGLRLRYARFGATSRPLKGTVIILPGRNECIEKYFETIRDFSARGL